MKRTWRHLAFVNEQHVKSRGQVNLDVWRSQVTSGPCRVFTNFAKSNFSPPSTQPIHTPSPHRTIELVSRYLPASVAEID